MLVNILYTFFFKNLTINRRISFSFSSLITRIYTSEKKNSQLQ